MGWVTATHGQSLIAGPPVRIDAPAAFFIALFYYLSLSPWLANLGFTVLYRPLIAGTLVGLILGDPLKGMQVGAAINILYLGWLGPGGTLPSDLGLAGYLGTALALAGNLQPEQALALAVPLGLLGIIVWNTRMTVDAFFVHWADRFAEQGDINGVAFCNVVPSQILLFTITFFPVFFGVLFGAEAVGGVLASLPAWLLHGLEVTGGMLAALGIALNLRFLFRGWVIPYFFLGFILAATTSVNILVIGVVGTALAALHVFFARGDAPAPRSAPHPSMGAGASGGERGTAPASSLAGDIGRKPGAFTTVDLFKSWLLWLFFSHANYNWERQQATAFAHSMTPIIRKLYTTKADISAALKRHLVFFNTQPDVGDAIHGIVIAMEEERASGADISDEAINAVKTGLMGPLAGVGDTLQQGIVIPILLAFGIGLARDGNFFGPILYVVLMAAFIWSIGWTLFLEGYRQGRAAVTRVLQGGFLSDVVTGAEVLGNFVLGALAVRFVSVTTPLVIAVGGTTIKLQEVLDSFMPKLLPLALVLFVWWLIQRRKISPLWVMVGLIAAALIGAYPWFGKFGVF
jgi:PTS system mannose-specific IID component